MNTELLILIFLVILNLILLGLFGYLVYFLVKNFSKFFKSRDKFSKLSMHEKVNYLENKDARKFFIIGLIWVNLIAIERIFRLYFFPDLGININFEEFSAYKLIIEIMISLIAISIIPSYFVVKMALKDKVLLKKVPCLIIVMFSAIPPIFAFINNYFTGNLLFSTVLIVYGVLFAVFALKFR